MLWIWSSLFLLLTLVAPLRAHTVWLPEDPGVLRSQQAGQWSDPATWGGVLPTATRRVFVDHAVVADSGEASDVYVVHGSLTIAGTLHIHGSMVIYSALLGSEGQLHFHVPDDRLMKGNTEPGPNPEMPDFHPGDRGLWVMPGAAVTLAAPTVTPWLDALPLPALPATPLKYGGMALPTIAGTQVRLAASPEGWRVGDTLLLTAVEGDYALATLTQVGADQIIAMQLHPEHAAFTAATIEAHGRAARPKIANLSRRFVILGSDVRTGDTAHRAHVVVMHGAKVSLQYVEFRNLGPRGKLGRYPVHFHHGMDTPALVEGASIWQDVPDPGNRFITLHNSWSVTLKHNVGLRSQGHGIFFESGEEAGNTLRGNLSVDVRGPEELANVETAQQPQTYHYWVRPRNLLEENVAVGTNARPALLAGLTALNTTIGRGKAVSPAHGLLLLPLRGRGVVQQPSELTDFTAFGTGKYGYHVGVHGTRLLRPTITFAGQSGNAPSAMNQAILQDPVFFYNGDRDPTYPSQLYLSSNTDVIVQGGMFLGKVGVHIHYPSTVMLTGTTIQAEFLLAPTYWMLNMVLQACQLEVQTLFQGAYPRNRNTPGLLRIDGCHGIVKGVPYTQTSPYTADFTGYTSVNVPAFVGQEEPHRGRRLLVTAPASGFLATSWPRGTTYSALAMGERFTAAFLVAENVTRWRAFAAVGGYPDGLPPGTYHVRVFRPDGTFSAHQCSIIAGAITPMDACSAYATPAVAVHLAADSIVVLPGGTASLRATLTNIGTAPAVETELWVDIPTGFLPEGLPSGATITPGYYGVQVRWKAGRVEPGTSLVMAFQVKAGGKAFQSGAEVKLPITVQFLSATDAGTTAQTSAQYVAAYQRLKKAP